MFGVHLMFVFQSEHVLSEYINQWNYNSTLEPGVDKAWVYEEKKTILGFFLIIVFFEVFEHYVPVSFCSMLTNI